jgi:thioredoxin-related protein
MKLFTAAITIFLFSSFINWETNFDKAKKTAKEKQELILLNFSGSDWCVPCMNMRKEIFESPVFQKLADADLILVNADFPRKKKNKPAADILKQNNALAEKYNPDGNFPFTVLLNADGKVLKTWNGKPDSTPEKFAAEIEKIYTADKALK